MGVIVFPQGVGQDGTVKVAGCIGGYEGKAFLVIVVIVKLLPHIAQGHKVASPDIVLEFRIQRLKGGIIHRVEIGYGPVGDGKIDFPVDFGVRIGQVKIEPLGYDGIGDAAAKGVDPVFALRPPVRNA